MVASRPFFNPHAGFDQPRCEVRVLESPSLKTLVEAVDSFDVGAKRAEVAASEPLPAACRRSLRNGPSGSSRQRHRTIDLALNRGDCGIGNAPVFDRSAVRQRCSRKRFAQQHPTAGHAPTGFRQSAVSAHEVPAHDAVAVQIDQIVAARARGGAISYRSQTEPRVFLPDVRQRHRQ